MTTTFIEITMRTAGGHQRKELINAALVTRIDGFADGVCIIWMSDGEFVQPIETYEQMRRTLAGHQTQGWRGTLWPAGQGEGD